MRQWVLSVPKRLRYFMQRDGAVLDMVLRVFLRVIAQSPQTHSPGSAQLDKATLHIDPDWDLAPQPAPDFEVDQQINWLPSKAATQTRWRVAMRPPYPAYR